MTVDELASQPRTVIAMAPCWYTREHAPRLPLSGRQVEGAVYERCRHCHRDIVSTDARHWDIAGGIDMGAAGQAREHAFLSVVDVLNEVVVERFRIGAIPDEAGVQALRARITRDYGLDAPDCMLVLRDSRQRDEALPPAMMCRGAPLMRW